MDERIVNNCFKSKNVDEVFLSIDKDKTYVPLWKKLSLIFLQMVVIEKTMKFLNQLFVKNMI